MTPFQQEILQGIPDQLPAPKPYDPDVSHAPKRIIEGVLSPEEKILAVRNALRYFPTKHHAELAPEFAQLQELSRFPRQLGQVRERFGRCFPRASIRCFTRASVVGARPGAPRRQPMRHFSLSGR